MTHLRQRVTLCLQQLASARRLLHLRTQLIRRVLQPHHLQTQRARRLPLLLQPRRHARRLRLPLQSQSAGAIDHLLHPEAPGHATGSMAVGVATVTRQ